MFARASGAARRTRPAPTQFGQQRRNFKLVDSEGITGFRTVAMLGVFTLFMGLSVGYETYQERNAVHEPVPEADEVMAGTAPVRVLPSGKWVMLDGSICEPRATGRGVG